MTKKKLAVIGKPLRKIDAMAKCAGETVFADDLNLPRMTYAKLLRSPHPHARVLSIDAARALKLDGVFTVITGQDLPEKFGIMPSTQDEETLAIDKVRYAGDPVAAVAATSESLAEKALRYIDVEYEVLKPILTIEAALASTEESERIHTWTAGSRARTMFLRAPFSIKVTPTCRWSSTARWVSTAPTISSPFGLPPRRRTIFIVPWPKF
jgi:CO/xanthine dehydrogenase Mo-binding subunit